MKRLTLLLAALLFTPSIAKASLFTDMVDRSVSLHIKAKGDDGKWHHVGCSGTFIDGSHILTAAHCLENPDGFIWAKDDKDNSFTCKLVKKDVAKDLALLAISEQGHVFAVLGRPGFLGEYIFNVGSPFGLDFLLSEGIIGKLSTHILPFTGTFTVTTAMINPGSSGGGLFDLHGSLIGVNTISRGGMFGWAGISCAVDLQTVKEFLR